MTDPRALLTAREAAARLGVQPATLYAYVSRGQIRRIPDPDGRRSRFDPAEVDALRASRRRRARGELETVLSTRLTSVDDGGLLIRGVDPVALVRSGAGFEQLVALILGTPELEWTLPGEVRDAVERACAALPEGTTPIDTYRVVTAVASALDPLRFDLTAEAVGAAASRLLLALVSGLRVRGRAGSPKCIADSLWPRLTVRRGNPARRRVLDLALALLVDHGLATSTFGARVAASVRADPYSVVSAGLGVLAGPLHGGSTANVHRLLAEVHATGDADGALGDARRRLGHLPGFGHVVYRRVDPRLAPLLDGLHAAWEGDDRLATVERVRERVARRSGPQPNIDLGLGALIWLADMDPTAGEAIFALSRAAGWIAHGCEEYGEAPMRFRPQARYVGPPSGSDDGGE